MAENAYHVRSISLPSRSHPLMSKVEEEINKMKTWEQSSLTKETICIGLRGLKDLYDCVEDLLQLPHIQEAFAHYQQEKCVEELLDGSLKLLDLCGTLRDVSLQMKEHVQDLQSTLRRGRTEESGSKSKYICYMKMVKKELSKGLQSLKHMDNKCTLSPLLDQEQHLSMVIRILNDARVITISIFQLIFSFMFASVPKQKPSKWMLVSKLMDKGQVTCEVVEENGEKMSQKRLHELEVKIEGIENGLESTFRDLVQTRVDLLNIFSH